MTPDAQTVKLYYLCSVISFFVYFFGGLELATPWLMSPILYFWEMCEPKDLP
jgi:hypothetical protein